MPAEPVATPPPPVAHCSGGSALLVLGQRRFGIALGDASSLTGGSVTLEHIGMMLPHTYGVRIQSTIVRKKSVPVLYVSYGIYERITQFYLEEPQDTQPTPD